MSEELIDYNPDGHTSKVVAVRLLLCECFQAKRTVNVVGKGETQSDLGLHQPVDDGLQRLVPVAGQNPLEVLRAMLQGFSHRHIQVVVRLFRRQVLREQQPLDQTHTLLTSGL